MELIKASLMAAITGGSGGSGANLQTKQIIPATNTQAYTRVNPDTGYDGFSYVEVKGVKLENLSAATNKTYTAGSNEYPNIDGWRQVTVDVPSSADLSNKHVPKTNAVYFASADGLDGYDVVIVGDVKTKIKAVITGSTSLDVQVAITDPVSGTEKVLETIAQWSFPAGTQNLAYGAKVNSSGQTYDEEGYYLYNGDFVPFNPSLSSTYLNSEWYGQTTLRVVATFGN